MQTFSIIVPVYFNELNLPDTIPQLRTMLRVLGEYLWRTLDETRKRPVYVIDETIRFKESRRRTEL